MAKRKEELTTEDAPDSIAPWQMLEDDEIESITARLQAKLPERNVTAFARRDDNDHVACFDRGPQLKSDEPADVGSRVAGDKAKTVIVVDRYSGETIRQFEGFTAWFDSVTATKSR